jgi:hypothetical protein
MGRQPHHPPLTERFETVPPAPENPTPVEAMAHRLRTPESRDLYALRKQTPEPVFGIIKAALGFRQFSLRGRDKVRILSCEEFPTAAAISSEPRISL